ncbi:helix-turn-helix domain-containing protein [Microscilla marina]|uniref:Transcriptional regulator, AraC family protein n=1 Tax=Microscilla marina ATCC 23134 TaxID=313606 RepID=A1ZQS5_MICM2|nr:helix-turn-helix domain-containing protein [Microscilla marina]EAY27230.1 transcriptional regulator, AraC family protein [Microscilla marina ATCC 23134]
MKHFKTISAYCKGINISAPKHPHFDIRSFEENMTTVAPQMSVFRHEFYAIAIKAGGDGKAMTGHFADFPEGTTVFFNTPFQLLSWNIVPNWQGYYLMFSQDFVAQSHILSQILKLFPFLKIEQSIPFEVPPSELPVILSVYQNIWNEYNGTAADKFQIIEAHVYLLLSLIKRLFEQQVDDKMSSIGLKTTNLQLLSRYQTLIQTSFYQDTPPTPSANLHSTSYYSNQLHIHPNHLNAVVKKLTGITALNHIHHHLLMLAKAYLAQTTWSIKEIAYTLYFDSPNNFSSFFKKRTGKTPLEYRQKTHL